MYGYGSVQKQSSFSRTLANEEKAGFYPTDPAHCRAINRFLEFPKEGDVLCLEPSIGDGTAVLLATGKREGDNLHILGAELSEARAKESREKEGIEDVVCGDFLRGVTVSPSSFTFCFSNPPYEADASDGIRLEAKFLERITPLMKAGGILVYVIPENQFLEPSMFLKLYNRFEFLHVYRFHEEEYKKYHQIVLIGQKKKVRYNILKDERDKLIEFYKENIEELPFDYEGEKVQVPESDMTALREFRTTRFPAAEVAEAIRGDGITAMAVNSFMEAMSTKVFSKMYDDGDCDRPPIHPNKDSMYLLGVCGKGQGLCGSEEEGNLHLQRGTVKMVENLELKAEDLKAKNSIIATTRAQVTYKVVESDGTITELV